MPSPAGAGAAEGGGAAVNAQGYYSRLIGIGRRANPTYREAQRDLRALYSATLERSRFA